MGFLNDGGSGIISSAINAVSQYFTNKSNQRNVDRTNEANRQLAQDQMTWNENMWQKMADWDKPSNQLARIKEAGLNPALMYGSGDAGNVSSAPNSPELPSQQAYMATNPDFGNLANSFLEQRRIALEASRTEKQNQLTEQQIRKTVEDSDNVRANTEAIKNAMKLTDAQTDEYRSKIVSYEVQNQLWRSQMAANGASVRQMERSIYEQESTFESRLTGILLDNDLKRVSAAKSYAEIRKIAADIVKLQMDVQLGKQQLDFNEVMNILKLDQTEQSIDSHEYGSTISKLFGGLMNFLLDGHDWQEAAEEGISRNRNRRARNHAKIVE